MRKIIILILLTTFTLLFSEEIELTVVKVSRVQVLHEDFLRNMQIFPGEIVSIDSEKWENRPYSGNIKVKYKTQDIFIDSWGLIEKNNNETFHGSWVSVVEEIVLNQIKYNPFAGSTITPSYNLLKNEKIMIFDYFKFSEEEYVFVSTLDNRYGWVKVSLLPILNNLHRKYTDFDKKNDELENEILSKTDIVKRNGIKLEIPSLDLILLDNYYNPLHKQEYRVKQIIDERYVIYSESFDIFNYYKLIDTKSRTTINFHDNPQYYKNRLISIGQDRDIYQKIYLSIYNISVPKNIIKELQCILKVKLSIDNIDYIVSDNEITINLLKDTIIIESFSIYHNNNNWVLDLPEYIEYQQYFNW